MGKFYVTTPIYYANAAPHLGHAYTDVIADVLARWHRARGDKTLFLTGTDEHGAKIARAAERAGVAPTRFVEDHRKEFHSLLTQLGAANDDFIYTSDQERHWPGVEKIWHALEASGDLYKATYKGLYCVGHEAFVTEKDLVNGVCADHNQKPEVIEEENYFFKLSKYIPRIIEAIEQDEFRIMPQGRKNEVLSFLKGGVEDISVSRPARDISWGIPVPGDSDHMIYVWVDALPNYLTALGYGSADEKKFTEMWPADLHVIGKDILRFHAVIWPALLFSAGLSLPKNIFVHGMILSGGHKMSKTIGNVIDPGELIREYGADAFRFFCMKEIPFGEDGDITHERFREVYEGSLAHGIGNLVSRVSAMAEKYFNGTLKKPSHEILEHVPTKRTVAGHRFHAEGELFDRYFDIEIEKEFSRLMGELKLTEALSLLARFFSLLDGYIQDYEPYRLAKTDPLKAHAVLWNLALYCGKVSKLLEPFMPHTAERIGHIFSVTGDTIAVQKGESLFPSKEQHT